MAQWIAVHQNQPEALRSKPLANMSFLDFTQTTRFHFPAGFSELVPFINQLNTRLNANDTLPFWSSLRSNHHKSTNKHAYSERSTRTGSPEFRPWTLESADESLPTKTCKYNFRSLGIIESFWLVSFFLFLYCQEISASSRPPGLSV